MIPNQGAIVEQKQQFILGKGSIVVAGASDSFSGQEGTGCRFGGEAQGIRQIRRHSRTANTFQRQAGGGFDEQALTSFKGAASFEPLNNPGRWDDRNLSHRVSAMVVKSYGGMVRVFWLMI